MFDPSTLPRQAGQLLLITDRVEAPAEFIILAILASHLKQAPCRKCILVSFSQVFSHWSSVATRLSPPLNLSAHMSKGSFVFVDAFSEELNASATSLRPLYDKLSELVKGNESQGEAGDNPNVIILDGVSMLEWSGTPTLEVKRFIRALRALCKKSNTTLIVRHHRVSSNHLDDLQRSLLLQCALYLEVLPLASGRSSAISGEIALHAGPLLDCTNSFAPIHRSEAIQYRLRDAGATYFGRGTSAVVL